MDEASRLIAVSLESIRQSPYPRPDMSMAQVAVIRGESTTRDLSFQVETGLLSAEQAERCEALRDHGFTAVEAPSDWRYGYRGPGGWREVVIQQAMKRVASGEGYHGGSRVPRYDAELAKVVLETVNKFFPKSLSMVELKHELHPEPSDDLLLTALEGLLIERLVEGPQLRSGSKLFDMGEVRITAEGRRHLEGRTAASISHNGPVIHGDQIVNYGQVAAIGRHSHGMLNASERWKEIEGETDLQVLGHELELLRTEYRKTASSREDDRQVALLADASEEAEKGHGAGMANFLSKVGKGVLNVAKDIGVDLAAKVIGDLIKRD